MIEHESIAERALRGSGNSATSSEILGLRDSIVERMASMPFGNAENPEYWYPLAIATYGLEEVLQAVDSMASFKTTMWEKTRTFEDLFGDMFGGEAVMVNSGSSADLLLMYALLEQSGGSLGSGQKVCVPAVTWPTHLWSIMMAGLEPVLIDVEPSTLNMSIKDLEARTTADTGAIFPVHLMGNPADMSQISRVAESIGALVIEDCCEALGAKWSGEHVGSFSQGGTFSFFFSHHMTTMEGGMVLTNDPELADRLRLLRAHGWSRNVKNRPNLSTSGGPSGNLDPRYTFVEWGFNLRPTEIQAGFGLEQLKRLPAFSKMRQRNFDYFCDLLGSSEFRGVLSTPTVHELGVPSWMALPLIVDESSGISRDDLVEYLKSRGVETRPIVAGNLARHPVGERFPRVFQGEFPGADYVHNNGFYVGLYPIDMNLMIDRFFEVLSEYFSSHL